MDVCSEKEVAMEELARLAANLANISATQYIEVSDMTMCMFIYIL